MITRLNFDRALEMAYATFLMILALYKAAIIWKETAGLKGINLAKVLVRDQAVYFIAYVPLYSALYFPMNI